MTLQEFSNNFDILANSFGNNTSSFVFDEYEKSVFLTKAQEQLVIELYTGKGVRSESFEETEEVRSYLRGLIRTDEIPQSSNDYKGISEYSKFFVMPEDVLFITYEAIRPDSSQKVCTSDGTIPVLPVTQDEFHRIKRNPFKQANSRRALRLDYGQGIVEVVSKYNVDKYIVRYLSRPTPIVLGNFTEVTDDPTMQIPSECKLDPALHRDILERGVSLAIASKSTQNKNV